MMANNLSPNNKNLCNRDDSMSTIQEEITDFDSDLAFLVDVDKEVNLTDLDSNSELPEHPFLV